MEIAELEKHIVDNGKNIAVIQAKLFNGLTADVAEIKTIVTDLATNFQTYQTNREETCPLNKRRETRGKGTARLMGIIGVSNAVILGIAMLILKVVHVI